MSRSEIVPSDLMPLHSAHFQGTFRGKKIENLVIGTSHAE